MFVVVLLLWFESKVTLYGYTTYRPGVAGHDLTSHLLHDSLAQWISDHDLKLNDKSANCFYCQGNGCQHVLKLWWLMASLWKKKSSPINILGSWYPPTCHGATMLLISAPGPRNTWACSTTTFIVILILRMLYTTSVRPLLEYSD